MSNRVRIYAAAVAATLVLASAYTVTSNAQAPRGRGNGDTPAPARKAGEGTGPYKKMVIRSVTLIDGSTFRIPRIGVYSIRGVNMEKEGVAPDVFVDALPDDARRGVDPQLDKAVDVVSFSHRGLGGHLVWSGHFCDHLNQYFANAASPTQGREGNIHHGDPAARSLPISCAKCARACGWPGRGDCCAGHARSSPIA